MSPYCPWIELLTMRHKRTFRRGKTGTCRRCPWIPKNLCDSCNFRLLCFHRGFLLHALKLIFAVTERHTACSLHPSGLLIVLKIPGAHFMFIAKVEVKTLSFLARSQHNML